jgi:membrane AbrB-like protein
MLRSFSMALAIGVPAGMLCAWLRSPLPWLIGPLVACAIASGAGLPLRGPLVARHAGQWAIGATLGLYFTPEVVGRLAMYAGPIFSGIAWAVLVGLGCAWALRRFADADPATAFFAGAVGAASEMALQGERNGGRVETIAAAHSLRIMMVVIILPFSYRWLDIRGSDLYQPSAAAVVPTALLLLVAVTIAGALLMKAARLPNAWVIGPLLASAALTASGHAGTAMPAWVVNSGQVLIGVSLGTRFAPGFFRRAPRILSVVFASTLVAIGASALFGLLLSRLSGISPATLVLATAPGGVAEMSLTAKVLKLGVPIVTVFHVTRMAALVLLLGSVYRWFAKRRGWPHDLRPAARRDGGGDRDGDD